MGRRIALFLIAALILGSVGFAIYSRFTASPAREIVEEPVLQPTNKALPTSEEFARLAEEDPVGMFEACLRRFERDGIKGVTATLEKQERVEGDLHERELLRLAVAGELPEHPGEHAKIRVRMIWDSGFRKVFGVRTLGTIYPNPDTNDRNEMKAYTSIHISKSIGTREPLSRSASRYSIADAGIYRGMLRTYDAWKKRQAAGELHAQYLGMQSPKELGGRVCHVIRRTCTIPEVDSYAMDEVVNPKANPQRDGAVEITVYVDTERWLQIGTVLKRADGELLAEYFFRDVELSNTELQPDPFTMEALKAAVKK